MSFFQLPYMALWDMDFQTPTHTHTHTRVPKFIGNNVANFLCIQGEMEDEGGIGTVLTHNEGADFVIDELIVW